MTQLIVRSTTPFNAETALSTLRRSYFTGAEDFYVRSHGEVPAIAHEDYRLRVDGRVGRTLRLGMTELATRFPHHSVPATLQCAGNRRAELHALKPVSGDPWTAGAIGTACWGGVALRDVLQAAGADMGDDLHVVFEAADAVPSGEAYSVSIPMEKALQPEVLLAFTMNDRPLSAAHGAPLRAVVPGFAGVRSAKWLTGIQVSLEPAEGPIQRHDYKLFPADVTAENADWVHAPTINELPLTSAICIPADGAEIPAGMVTVSGYAFAATRSVTRVEVSDDGGQHWHQATLQADKAPAWTWTFWRADLPLGPGSHELAVRAWDSAGQAQPRTPDDLWNFKGYLCCAYHRVKVRVR